MPTETETETEKDAAIPKAVSEGPWLKEWRRRIMSGEQVIETVGTEPQAVERAIQAGAALLKLPTITWDCANGFVGNGVDLRKEIERLSAPPSEKDPEGLNDPGLLQPSSAVHGVSRIRLAGPDSSRGSAVFVVHNFYPFFGDPVIAQALENLVKTNKLSCMLHGKPFRRPIHFVQCPYKKLDLKGIETVRQWFTPMPFDLPGEDEIYEEQVADLVTQAKESEKRTGTAGKNRYDEKYLRGVAASARGLERHRATTVFFYAASKLGGLTDRLPVEVRKEAAKLIAESTALEVVPEDDIAAPDQLGGIANARRTLERAARTFTAEARAQFLDHASGLWLAGMPGTGKSELAKTAARVFQQVTERAFTVLRVRMGALYGGIVGETEANWYDVERRVEAFGPDTIVWLDEADKAFGGVMGDTGGSGVRQGLFGLLLSWLSHPKRKAYVICAMNSPEGIPGEFFRRFDDGFFFDLPGPAARLAIAKIHFAKRLKKVGLGLDALGFSAAQWAEVAAGTDGWIPSEIEGLVKQSRDRAFETSGVAVPSFAAVSQLVRENAGTILSVQKKDQLAHLRHLCQNAKAVDDAAAPPADTVSLATAEVGKNAKPRKRGLVLEQD